MWNEINFKKIKSKTFPTITGFVIIGIVIGIVGIGYGAIYLQTSKVINKVKQLESELERQKISREAERNEKLLKDELEYTQGIEEFDKGKWRNAKELLSRVSESSPHYQDSRDKIDEAQSKIIDEAVRKATAGVGREWEELEQKIWNLQQKQESQDWGGYEISEIVEDFGKYIVNVACFNKSGGLTAGSGIIYNQGHWGESIILTNYHIIKYADLTLEHPCIVSYFSDPTKGLADFYFADPVYWPNVIPESTMQSIDFYFLSIKAKFKLSKYKEFEIIPNASLSITDLFPVVCSSDEIKVGKEVVVLGYPTIGGKYLTATEGIISSFSEENYLITSAKIEQGSSGGGVFLKQSGCLVGTPTFVKLGKIESFARLIDMSYLQKNYL